MGNQKNYFERIKYPFFQINVSVLQLFEYIFPAFSFWHVSCLNGYECEVFVAYH